MKIGILGTRGIPNHHGGFEQFAEYFAVYLSREGHDVCVYNSSQHPFTESEFQGVRIIHCYDAEHKIGTAGQFIYDLNCIRDSRKRNFDVLLQLGYTSSSVWGWLLPRQSVVVTNMDGLEWKRSKYSKPVRRFLKWAEKLAVKTSDYLIADSLGIQNYLIGAYGMESEYIAYGASVFSSPDQSVLNNYDVEEEQYNMLIARMEPENNIETILDGVVHSTDSKPFLVIGKCNTPFSTYLRNKYRDNSQIRFLGGIYNQDHLNNLRYYSNLYLHGHSVGGTNPSLLEAMASSALIVAHDNEFNRSILKSNALYFNDHKDVSRHLNEADKSKSLHMVANNLEAIDKEFNWDLINSKYLTYLLSCAND